MKFFILLNIALLVLMLVATWKVFTKANQPGIASIVPIWNIIVYCKIAGVNLWLILALFIPGVNILVGAYVSYKFFTAYVSGGLAVLGIFLPIIVIPYIAFGDVYYSGN